MQNRKKLRQKATMGVKKRRVTRGGKYLFQKGTNINFGPEYRPLPLYSTSQSLDGFDYL
jgi:hypothetical protein